MKDKRNGFTIVELLIVIVVIGILAALVLNVIQDVQKRARNTQRVTTAKAYQTMINSYMIVNGEYPHIGSACLGRLKVENICWGVGGGPHQTSPEESLDEALMTVSPQLPEVDQTPVRSSGYIKEYIGPGYAWNTVRYVDGEQVYLTIDYWLEGTKQACGMTVIKNVGYADGQSNYTRENGTGYTNTDDLMTFCSAPVFDPNNL